MNQNRQEIHHALWTCTCIILGIMHNRSISLIMPSKWDPYFSRHQGSVMCLVCVARVQHHGHGEKIASIHFDNYSGQNKNNFVLWYGLWRVLVGLHMIVEYSMMVAGHTKFDPDWHFGVWKVKWRSSTAETMNEVAETVRHSSRRGHNIPQLVSDPQKPVKFSNWKSFLQRSFKPMKNIRGYHHFRVNADTPGVV
ncbi:uncharacterized protein LOC125672351 isoform X2 [Ostrea edulis]|uniref:uncharacterized protein LOC125672351 isoform X2 n=1 Tax=Ostrea edulis TaxID=37623 RepID=UPI0024AF37ED|nr:uncharacterized protein LOC125672351 isoform X2 [Ostrea edulis]